MRATARVHETCAILCCVPRVHKHSFAVCVQPPFDDGASTFTTLAALLVDHCSFRKPAAPEIRRITLENATTQNQTRPVQDGSKTGGARVKTGKNHYDVIYLDAGHIVEHGSFEELMTAKGTFYQQVNARGDE